MARVLIIDERVKSRIAELIEKASGKPYSYEQLKSLSLGFDPNDPKSVKVDPKMHEEFTIDLPVGYRVTYTQEYQPVGLCRHVSVAVPVKGKCPNPAAVQEIMTLFGFKLPLEKSFSYGEKYKEGFTAINVIEKIE